MNKNAVITTAVIFTGLTALETLKKAREARKQQEQLQKNLKSIRALAAAHKQVMKNFENDEYKYKTYDDILTDYEFYKLVNNPTV